MFAVECIVLVLCTASSKPPCAYPASPPRLCLKGRTTLGAIPQQLQSGCRGLRARFGGGFRRFEMRLRLVLGSANAFGVALGPESGEGGEPPTPPPPHPTRFKQFPAPPPCGWEKDEISRRTYFFGPCLVPKHWGPRPPHPPPPPTPPSNEGLQAGGRRAGMPSCDWNSVRPPPAAARGPPPSPSPPSVIFRAWPGFFCATTAWDRCCRPFPRLA